MKKFSLILAVAITVGLFALNIYAADIVPDSSNKIYDGYTIEVATGPTVIEIIVDGVVISSATYRLDLFFGNVSTATVTAIIKAKPE